MKYRPFLALLLLSMAACGNPVSPALKWIGTPEDDNLGFSEMYFGIKDPELILPSITDGVSGVVTITIDLNPSLNPGTGAPYTGPKWFLSGESEPCEPASSPFDETFKGKLYWLSDDSLTIKIDVKSLSSPSLQVRVVVTGSDNRPYDDEVVVYK